ncbi:hypothetical protein K0M31_012981 [Melipona bicolor]|uniref:Uncharacterized protein n=1 Tax=Melipona bicolor TaxID=60889 RepID=A0AA40KH56_9HYME|nr:hypothetical protein K0M31_012981 [Melipona bicolor]
MEVRPILYEGSSANEAESKRRGGKWKGLAKKGRSRSCKGECASEKDTQRKRESSGFRSRGGVGWKKASPTGMEGKGIGCKVIEPKAEIKRRLPWPRAN